MKAERHPQIDLINGIQCLLADNLNCNRSWGFFLFSPEFDGEPELRNRIGAIWLCSLLDSVEGEARVLESYQQRAASLGMGHLVSACDEVALFIDSVEELLARYSRDEQIFLADYRDQCVHSWLGRRHNLESTFKYYDGQAHARVKLTKTEHAMIVLPYYEAGVLSKVLYDLVQKFRDLRMRYWHATIEMIKDDKLGRWYAELLSGRFFEFDALHTDVSGDAQFVFSGPRRRDGAGA